jgi:hypothetical protein
VLLEEADRVLALAVELAREMIHNDEAALTVEVPSISRARVIMFLTCFSTAAVSTGSDLWYMIASWKLPSPRWPTIEEKTPRSFSPFVEASGFY